MEQELRQALAVILTHVEVSHIDSNTLKFMEEIVAEYFRQLGNIVTQYAEQNHRSKPTWKDCFSIEKYQSLETLEKYLENEIAIAQGNPEEYPNMDLDAEYSASTVETLKKQKGSLNSETLILDPPGILAQKKEYVPVHMPPFPPAHSYLQTKVSVAN